MKVIMTHEENDFTCELCYDILNTKEELDSHLEFHKQIEDTDSLNPGIMETAIEIVENTKGKQDIITIQSKPVKLSLNKTIPSKKSLTATIKDMISPNEPKKSKIMFLPNIEEEKLKEKKKITNEPKPATISKQSDAAASLNETQPSPANSTITPEVSSSISTPSTSTIGNTALPTASNTHVDSSIECISIKEETSHVEENNTETTTDNTEST